MAGVIKNLKGKRFGRLMVIKFSKSLGQGKGAYWMCLCDCGSTKEISAKQLNAKHALSCGCLHKEIKTRNLLNKKFERLLVVEKSKTRESDGCIIWKCLCDCGNTCFVPSVNLKKNGTKSCGCLTREVNKIRLTKHGQSRTKEYSRCRGNLKRIWIMNTEVKIDYKELNSKLKKLENLCIYCVEGKYEQLDHIVPLSKGGTHTVKNLVPSCSKCNSEKSNKVLFLEWQPSNLHPILESTKRWFERHF